MDRVRQEVCCVCVIPVVTDAAVCGHVGERVGEVGVPGAECGVERLPLVGDSRGYVVT